MPRGEVGRAEVIALAILDRVGVLEAFLDLALARAADAGAAFERNAALLADRCAQQVRLLRNRNNLVVVGDERDAKRHHRRTSETSSAPKPTCLPCPDQSHSKRPNHAI